MISRPAAGWFLAACADVAAAEADILSTHGSEYVGQIVKYHPEQNVGEQGC